MLHFDGFSLLVGLIIESSTITLLPLSISHSAPLQSIHAINMGGQSPTAPHLESHLYTQTVIANSRRTGYKSQGQSLPGSVIFFHLPTKPSNAQERTVHGPPVSLPTTEPAHHYP